MDCLIVDHFQEIDSKDPAFEREFGAFFDKQVPIELRVQEPSGTQQMGAVEAIRVRVLKGKQFEDDPRIKIELTSENDIFFHYGSYLDSESFNSMLNSQKLMIDIAQLPEILESMLNSCIKQPNQFVAILIMDREGQARLDFIQNFQHKFVELLSLRFTESSEDIIRNQVIFRYEAYKSKVQHLHETLRELGDLFKRRHTNLLVYMGDKIREQASQRRQMVDLEDWFGTLFGNEECMSLERI